MFAFLIWINIEVSEIFFNVLGCYVHLSFVSCINCLIDVNFFAFLVLTTFLQTANNISPLSLETFINVLVVGLK